MGKDFGRIFCVGNSSSNSFICFDDCFLHIFLYCGNFKHIGYGREPEKYGGFIPGLRPGKPTADYLDRVMTRITLAGAVFLAFIAILPNFVAAITHIEGVYFGGTALLIIVGVALDTMKQIEAMVLMRHYQGFMKK